VVVALVREWTRDMALDERLFPRLDKKKTYTMVQMDLERAGTPYETHEGLADFHAGGRHSHITGLARSGATIMEAKELARHADIRQTAKCTHIGIDERAEALAGLNDHNYVNLLNYWKYVGNGAASWVGWSQRVTGACHAT
jgi:hypothetical protein